MTNRQHQERMDAHNRFQQDYRRWRDQQIRKQGVYDDKTMSRSAYRRLMGETIEP